MNYFQEYEKLRKENSLITPGSIWEDFCGEVRIINVIRTRVYYANRPSGTLGRYSLNNFIKDFHRVF